MFNLEYCLICVIIMNSYLTRLEDEENSLTVI